MIQARAEFGIMLLANGQVLVVGGCTAYDANGCACGDYQSRDLQPRDRHLDSDHCDSRQLATQ